ncbi:WD40-repeat-containing domain protein [Sparassis latifolia]
MYPHSRLLLGPSHAVVVSGPHIQVINTRSGEIVHSTVDLEGAEKDALLKSGPVRCAAADSEFLRIITTGDDKKLKVWQIDGLKLLSERELPKKPTQIDFTRDGQTILVSDKFGDIFSYSLHFNNIMAPSTASLIGASKRGALTSHENPSNGTLVLGHVSFLICFLLSPDERYIITADRDEHIRVSWYPQGYSIESYCLGHEKFVSAVHIPAFAPSTLVSGGGDPVFKLWDWMTGTLQSEIPVLDAVKPFIKVQAVKGKWGREDGEDGEDDGAGQHARGKKKRGKRRKGKEQVREDDRADGEADGAPEVAEEAEDADTEGEGSQEADTLKESQVRAGTSRAAEGGGKSTAPSEEEQNEKLEWAQTDQAQADRFVLVVHKIQTIDFGAKGRFLIFSAVGATALFYCAFPDAAAVAPPTVQHVDFECPVIDFTIGADGLVWVLLDVAWSSCAGNAEEAIDKTQAVRLWSWATGAPTEVRGSDVPPLLASLQSKCIISATPDDLKTLDTYSALGSLPKNVDPEHDSLKRDILSEFTIEGDDQESALQAKGKGKGRGTQGQLTQREQARLKKKRALAEKLQKEARDGGSAAPDTPGGNAGERESKRAKSESDTRPNVEDINAMDES